LACAATLRGLQMGPTCGAVTLWARCGAAICDDAAQRDACVRRLLGAATAADVRRLACMAVISTQEIESERLKVPGIGGLRHCVTGHAAAKIGLATHPHSTVEVQHYIYVLPPWVDPRQLLRVLSPSRAHSRALQPCRPTRTSPGLEKSNRLSPAAHHGRLGLQQQRRRLRRVQQRAQQLVLRRLRRQPPTRCRQPALPPTRAPRPLPVLAC
jgi:hypothetical protein